MPRSSQAETGSLLIAAVSGRALAQACLRAGVTPLVVDFFADLDTQETAYVCRKLSGLKRGIRETQLLKALQELAKLAPSPVLGVMCGSGFDDRPKLLHRIAERWPLLGNDASTVRRIKAPDIFFSELARLGIPHPVMVFDPPPRAAGWLAKKIGGAGGSHIVPSQLAKSGPVYFQRAVEGGAVSALFLGNGREARVLGFSEQWTAPAPPRLWRYGGAVRPADLPPRLARQMSAAVSAVTECFQIKGLASADFVIAEADEALLLEVNPRPGATLDIFDSDAKPLMQLHIQAVREGRLPRSGLQFADAMASAIVYAPRRLRIPASMAWPKWTADRPKPSEWIDKNRPICTVSARADSAAKAKSLVQERIAELLACLKQIIGGNAVNKREEIAATQKELPSINAKAAPLVKALIDEAHALRVQVTRGTLGECRIDCGVRAEGGLEAGRRMAEICLGGLGRVALETTDTDSSWPFMVTVHTAQPVLACLGSQYAGWSLSGEDSGKKYNVLGSGPARAMGSSEKLFDELGYRDEAESAVLVLESDRPPPPALVEQVAKACKLSPERLTFVYAPTSSLAGTVQIAARCLEVALHKSHELHFPLDQIVDGIASAPLPPPAPDFVAAMGRTNDAIIYGGRVQLFVSSGAKEAKALADKLPSLKSKDYGKPFAEIFAAVKGDFYAIDRMLFSPAMVTVTSLKTGESFEAGRIDDAVLSRSFA